MIEVERIYSEDEKSFAVIGIDTWGDNPREDYDHDTVIVYYPCRHVLGDRQVDRDYEPPSDAYAFPLYAYIHSDVVLTMESERRATLDPLTYDTLQCGWIYIPRGKVASEAEARAVCQADVNEFAAYLAGEVYEYTVYRVVDGEAVEEDSFGDFYGYDAVLASVREALGICDD